MTHNLETLAKDIKEIRDMTSHKFGKMDDYEKLVWIENEVKATIEELQQLDVEQWCYNKNYSRHHAITIRQFIKDEILGENQQYTEIHKQGSIEFRKKGWEPSKDFTEGGNQQ